MASANIDDELTNILNYYEVESFSDLKRELTNLILADRKQHLKLKQAEVNFLNERYQMEVNKVKFLQGIIKQHEIEARESEVMQLNSLRQGHNHLSFASQKILDRYINQRLDELKASKKEGE